MLLYQNLDDYVRGEIERLQSLPKMNIPEQGIISRVLGPGQDQDRKSNPEGYSVTLPVNFLEIDSLGIYGDRHRRPNRPSTVREREVVPKGTIIREHRHIFAVSLYDCKVLSDKLEVDVTPELLGANLVIEREDGQDYSLSALPQGVYIRVYSHEIEERNLLAVLEKRVTQQGCSVTGNAIRKQYEKTADLTQRFVKISTENRGIVCSVESPVDHSTRIEAGQKVSFSFPKGKTL